MVRQRLGLPSRLGNLVRGVIVMMVVMVPVLLGVAGENWARVDMRTKVVSGGQAAAVRMAECC
jgi:hypothetical protein